MYMPRNTYGYDSYRGRSGLRTFLTAVITILLVVLVLAVCAFFLLQKYLVYTDDGQAHLELPFFQTSEAPAETVLPAESQEVILVIPTDTPEPTPTPVPVTHVLWLDRADLMDGSWGRKAEEAGVDAVLFDMKAEDGTLGYVSSAPDAIRLRTSGADWRSNTAMAAFAGSKFHTVARLSCFKDHISPYNDPNLAIRMANGYNWRDADNRRWLNVALPQNQKYITDVVKELVALGFGEILLDYSAFPYAGELSLIRPETYPDADRSVTVEGFYEAVKGALEGTDAKLSIVTTQAVMLGEDDGSGQTLELLAKYADHIYAPRPQAGVDYAETLKAAGLPQGMVVYTDPAGTALSDTESQLILP